MDCCEPERMMWARAHPHGRHCYQTELARRGYGNDVGACCFDPTVTGFPGLADALAVEWGLPDFGCATHCTCGRDIRLNRLFKTVEDVS